jgi:60 kDa SS-A/Ro ribonucleoprotein
MHITNHLAILRNLRNIVDADVSEYHLNKIRRALISPEWKLGARRVLPFRYMAAARACPAMAPALDRALAEAVGEMPLLPGKTVVLVDVSGSMEDKLSARSDLTRMDAAATLAAIVPGDVRVFTFSDDLVEVTEGRGLAGIVRIVGSQNHGGTYLGQAITRLDGGMANRSLGRSRGPSRVEMDRLIVITDEQSHDHVSPPNARCAYIINVGSAQNGVGYGERWVHLDGFSEQVIRFIQEFEKL